MECPCPVALFYDYYNPEGQCEWHYQPCGVPCMKTSRNPRGLCLQDTPGLEGCWSKCPPEAPIFKEDNMQCVATCPSLPPPPPCQVQGKLYRPGAVGPSDKNCHSCDICTESGVRCTYNPEACGEDCQWSRWLDVSRPGRGVDSGDFDTLDNLRAHGYQVCQAPRAVECRAEDAPDVPLQVLGQRVECSSAVGLVCYNRDQVSGLCDNYQLRVLCCSARACPTSRGPAHSTPPATDETARTAPTPGPTSVLTESTAPPAPVTTTGPTTSSTTSKTPAPGTSPPAPGTSPPVKTTLSTSTPKPASATASTTASAGTSAPGPCRQRWCSWTEWLDGSYPGAGIDSGDFDTFQNLRSKGYTFCERPSEVQCRAARFPYTPLAELGQDVVCNSSVGLVCRNRDQLPPICYNYQIRIQCCEWVDVCRERTTPPVTSETTHSTPHETTGVSLTSTQHQSSSSVHVPPATKTVPSTHVITPPGTTTCQPQCTWTKWFDVDFPSPGPHGGDQETYSNIVQSGEKICRRPEYITDLECRAENHPEVSIEGLGQVVQCNPDTGLVCHNRDQVGRFRMCLNYECTWTKWFDVDFPSPGPHGGDQETYSNIVQSGEKICRRPEYITDLECRAENHPEVSIEGLGQVVQCNLDTGLVCHNRDQVGRFRMCLNYEVRVLCCEPREGCPTSEPVTSVSITSPTETTSHVATSRTTSVPTTSVPETSTTSVPTTPVPITPVPQTSTTSAPITTTTPIPTPETTHTTPGTTTCQPQCTWTKWFDVDFPSPGPHGGDQETYSNIVQSGEKICHRPEYITDLECRAENHPEVSIEGLGQVVQCNLDTGLVCHNRDQVGRFRMCLNYEVRVLCCEPREGCPVSSVTPYVTSKHVPTTESPFVAPTVTSPSSAVPSTTTCYCSVSDKLYPAGSIVYQQVDLSGHCYYALCTLDCHVVRKADRVCPTSTPPTALVTSPPGSSPSSPVSVTIQGCPNAVPPRTKGETWAMPNCSQATCEGNNVITLQPRPCPQVQKPTCANGYPALKVADQDGCCLQYQCQCVCSGWGDPHYITFDGTYYTFLDNCTYVLVQQVVPVYGHFRVLIDNYFCDAEDGLSCPQSIIVEYRRERVVLTRKPVRGVMTNEIVFNGKVVSPGFGKGGIEVSQIGIKMYVTIPEIGVQVMFTGLIFSVEVPFSKFANNTEGQCGTCTNDPKDECRLPGGAVVASCSDMSGHWKVSNPDQPSCHGPPPTSPYVWPTTPAPCQPSPVCQLILSEVFELCHAVIPPSPYLEGCLFDHCHVTDANVVCSSLELYASLCASHGVCVDWRSWTNNTCPFSCPADKVYQPCGPSKPSYCYGGDSTSASLLALQNAGPVTEGCFCPEGTTLFSASTEVCVPTGCPTCNASYCPTLVGCPEGTRQILTYEDGACCPSQKCEWTVCSVNGTLYQPGAVVSSSLCETCRCEVPGGSSDTFRISCETQTCSTRCPLGFEYQAQSGRCCGQCVQVACVMNTSDSSAHLFYPGESWSDPGNRCVTHECEKHQNGLVVVTTRKACPSLSCPADQARLSEDGCCLVCPQPPPQNRSTCAVYYKHQVIRLQGCSSPGPVRLAYCQGNCGDTASMYSLEAQVLEHRCSCCRELRASPRNVTLHCADGSPRAFSYTQVEECGCVDQHCDAHGDLDYSQEPEAPQRRDTEHRH
uniref:Mucin 5AC, oligomeric mucus/gel-forming n=1 Tax=Molossus molossus TaxID=27622 RepID=A0A7J8BI04_MOLMO|nr:hypothetical protein HJG59_010457 [Molossus molossus]